VIGRRAILAGAGAAILAPACTPARGERGVLRLGLLANLTHAPVLAGLGSGRLAAALGATRLETRVFRAGPRVVEALLGNALDVAVAGPGPVLVGHAHHGGKLRVLGGCASGGASLVIGPKRIVHATDDLRGAALATPQLGCTQDISLRTYLRAHGLSPRDAGGNVDVYALSAPDILLQLARGELAGAWLPEPWATRAVDDLGAARFLDERDLWPGRRFPAALLVARSEFVAARPVEAEALRAGVAGEVARCSAASAVAEEESFAELTRLATNAGKRAVFHDAWARVDFTSDPLPGAFQAMADEATALDLVPRTSCEGLFA
jgi:sulfonate transport system substrate-binding protein